MTPFLALCHSVNILQGAPSASPLPPQVVGDVDDHGDMAIHHAIAAENYDIAVNLAYMMNKKQVRGCPSCLHPLAMLIRWTCQMTSGKRLCTWPSPEQLYNNQYDAGSEQSLTVYTQINVVAALYAQGASPTLPDTDGNTPVHMVHLLPLFTPDILCTPGDHQRQRTYCAHDGRGGDH